MEQRQALLWSGLLFGSQATDTMTTAIDRARGAVEMMPISNRLLEVGGPALFWTFKVLVVASAAAALLAAARMVRGDQRFSLVTFRVCLISVQVVTIVVVAASLSNLALLTSI